jgi:hypothetical protein
MNGKHLQQMSPKERRRKFPMGLGLLPGALPYFTAWRHLRWFLLFWLPNVVTFFALLPGHPRLMEHIGLALLAPVFLAFAFVSCAAGMASSNHGTFFRTQEPGRFWISVAIPAACYIALTIAYYFISPPS